MSNASPFKWRHFEAEIILLCVRWYLRYALSYRDLEEMMRERGLHVDHTTIYRWVQHYAPELEKRCKLLCWLLIISVRSIRPVRAHFHVSRSLPIPQRKSTIEIYSECIYLFVMAMGEGDLSYDAIPIVV